MTMAREMVEALQALIEEHGDLRLVTDMDTDVYVPEFNDEGDESVLVIPVDEPS